MTPLLLLVLCVAAAHGCGVATYPPAVSRVVNGEEAVPHSWPWQVSLQYIYDGLWYHTCGGSLVAPNWVLTAAHCISSENTYRVQLGKHNLRQFDSGQETINVIGLFNHPNWDPNSLSNGLPLILPRAYPSYCPEPTPHTAPSLPLINTVERHFTLDTNVTYGDTIKPACLPPAGHVLPDQFGCYVTGWGYLQTEGPAADKLQQGLLRVVKYATCARLDWWFIYVRTNMICAGGDGIVSSCYLVQFDVFLTTVHAPKLKEIADLPVSLPRTQKMDAMKSAARICDGGKGKSKYLDNMESIAEDPTIIRSRLWITDPIPVLKNSINYTSVTESPNVTGFLVGNGKNICNAKSYASVQTNFALREFNLAFENPETVKRPLPKEGLRIL
ncbi:hypothetical protein XELAEV_18036517mg [Xenopus laevis]|uniref:Peptidase S1 domain-containing protein n=1 Tax=Xenopus laevis TaxID=8355 RepID=A0A974CHR3_XENLA|nr:hypothetical protein XELAEV_18036517mg [Xenopus laevis]